MCTSSASVVGATADLRRGNLANESSKGNKGSEGLCITHLVKGRLEESDGRISQFVKRFAEMIEHIAGKERLLAGASTENCDFCSAPANPRAEAGGIVK
jgi:hypothetical protein